MTAEERRKLFTMFCGESCIEVPELVVGSKDRVSKNRVVLREEERNGVVKTCIVFLEYAELVMKDMLDRLSRGEKLRRKTLCLVMRLGEKEQWVERYRG